LIFSVIYQFEIFIYEKFDIYVRRNFLKNINRRIYAIEQAVFHSISRFVYFAFAENLLFLTQDFPPFSYLEGEKVSGPAV